MLAGVRPNGLTIDLTDPEVLWILSLPNFRCAPIAHILQRNGHEIEASSEKEQAAVMVWLLHRYHAIGGKPSDWRTVIDAELDAMQKANPPASTGLESALP